MPPVRALRRNALRRAGPLRRARAHVRVLPCRKAAASRAGLVVVGRAGRMARRRVRAKLAATRRLARAVALVVPMQVSCRNVHRRRPRLFSRE